MKKRTISILLTMVISAALCVPAFAAPQAAEIMKTQVKGAVCTFSAEDFEDAYTNDDTKSLESIELVSVPAATSGKLNLGTAEAKPGQSVSVDEMSNLSFVPSAEFVGETTFAYKAYDGTAYSPAANVKIIYTNEAQSVPTAESFSLEVTKNTPKSAALKYKYDGADALSFIIVDAPQKGGVDVTGTQGEFTYTPHQDQTGTDSFTFRVQANGIDSNIATCTITILDAQTSPSPEPFQFTYTDMQGHWANYSAVKMVEKDIVKGERIGSKYYFYPDKTMTRIDVINYLLAALHISTDDVDMSQSHIFADSKDLPDYINRAAYKANELGIIEGERDGDEIYLRPYANIRRVEMIKMIDNAMGPKTRSDVELDFIDAASIPDWAVQHVKNMVGYGIVQGYDDKTLRPFENITKAQTVEMMYQMIKYNEENSSETLAQRINSGAFGKRSV